MAKVKTKLAVVETDLEDTYYWSNPYKGSGSAGNQGPQEDPNPILYGKNGQPIYKPERRIGFVKPS